MSDEQLNAIEQRLGTHINERWEHNSPYADIYALIVEVRRLQAALVETEAEFIDGISAPEAP